MERHHGVLAGLLAIQLLIVAIVWFFDGGRTAADVHRLMDVDRNAITAIEIDDRTDSVRIDRTGEAWQLPGDETLPADEALPADEGKVSALLEKLESAEAPWPVATSESSAERFEVTESNYQRRIRLHAGEEAPAELLFGTSPGFRKVHARVSGATDVYAVTFANYEASTKADEWLDKTLLQPAGSIRAITRTGAYTITLDDGAWLLADAKDGETLNQDTARDLASKLANLRVLGRAETPPAADAAPLIEFQIEAERGATTLRLYRTGDEGDFVVGSDRYKAFFRASEYVGEGLNFDRTGLLVPAATEAD